MNPALSLIIPAYNERSRLPGYLLPVRQYLNAAFGRSYEVIVVDDGSTDGLWTLLADFRNDWGQLTLRRHTLNQGKGAAVRTGMLAARGDLLLFADADGATPFEEERKLRAAIEQGAEVAIGSRLFADALASRKRLCHRQLSGRLFAWLVRRLFSLPLRDTQCGFKMFHRGAALRLFPSCQEAGYLFDVEILASAHQLGYRIAEIPVSWSDMAGSKVRLVRDGWRMFHGLWRLRRSLHRRVPCPTCPPSWQESGDTAAPLALGSFPKSAAVR